jgi:hypothetical protein
MIADEQYAKLSPRHKKIRGPILDVLSLISSTHPLPVAVIESSERRVNCASCPVTGRMTD